MIIEPPMTEEEKLANLRVLETSKKVASYAQALVSTSGTRDPMVDFVMVMATAHAYVLQFSIEQGADKEEVLNLADRTVRRMVDVVAQMSRRH